MKVKKLKILAIILNTYLSLMSFNAVGKQSNTATILVYGDSLSAGYGLENYQDWPFLLNNRLKQEEINYHVINLSISGETTEGGLLRLPRALEQYQPEIIIIELGANDGLRGQSIRKMSSNLTNMIRLSQESGADVLLTGIHIPPNYGKRYTQHFHETYKKLQAQHNIELIPFLLTDIHQKPHLFQMDGLHPTATAQPIILNTVWKFLKPLLQVKTEDGRLSTQ